MRLEGEDLSGVASTLAVFHRHGCSRRTYKQLLKDELYRWRKRERSERSGALQAVGLCN